MRWSRHHPVLTVALRINRLNSQTLLGSNTFIRHVSGRGTLALVAILPSTLAGDVGDIDWKLETRERKRTLHNIERATRAHGTKAGHALGITWRKNAWRRTNIDMDGKLVNSNKRNKGAIRSGAEKLRTQRGGHDVVICFPELDSDAQKGLQLRRAERLSKRWSWDRLRGYNRVRGALELNDEKALQMVGVERGKEGGEKRSNRIFPASIPE
jgi:hypothetical protein